MAYSPGTHDKGTRFTNYSSIHSADAFVGDYQVMYTPGSTSPQVARGHRKSSRFARGAASVSNKQIDVNQSYLLPSNMPNTSQIMPDHGVLPNIQVHYNIPADEKQIVASLRSLQRDLSEAIQTINDLTRERDEAVHELRLLRATSRKPSSPVKKHSMAARVEEELFDLSRSEASPPQVRQQTQQKRVAIDKQINVSDNARVLPPAQVNGLPARQDKRLSSKMVQDNGRFVKHTEAEDTEQSVVVNEDPTAASNTSRRRRRTSLDDNMTSAYILPDITEHREPAVSKEAQQVLHSLEPEHVARCEVCHRLLSKSKSNANHKRVTSQPQPQAQLPSQRKSVPQDMNRQQVAKVDYTAAMAGLPTSNNAALEDSYAHDLTMRPKVMPDVALERVRALMQAQFQRAKERHQEAWHKYDRVQAPMESRKHAGVAKEMRHWSEKMEECRVHLDYLRDVEEGIRGSESD